MKVVVLGPRASGKSTLSKALSVEFNVPHVSMGIITQQEIQQKTEVGLRMQFYMAEDIPYPHNFLTRLMTNHLSTANSYGGFILEGYPRRENEAIELNEILKQIDISLTFIFNLKVPLEVVLERARNRLICTSCGYQTSLILINSREALCPLCSIPLVGRKDDMPDNILKAFYDYQKTIDMVIHILCAEANISIWDVDSAGTSEALLSQVLKQIKQGHQK